MHDGLPLVTVGIPTYNSSRYLRVCLDSVLAQTYPRIEIIVADNASSDDTVAIVQEYQERQRIRLIRHDTNIGAGNNFNALVRAAQGEYVALYHSDDYYAPHIVERCVDILRKDAAIALVGTMAGLIDEQGVTSLRLSLHPRIRGLGKQGFTLDDAFLGIMLQTRRHYFFVTPSVMARRSAYEEAGFFRIHDRYRSAGDYEMWLRIAERHLVFIIDDALMSYRVHSEQGSEREVRLHSGIPDIIPVLDEYCGKLVRRDLQEMWSIARRDMLIATTIRLNSLGMFEDSSRIAALTDSVIAHCIHFFNTKRLSIGAPTYEMIVALGRAAVGVRNGVIQYISRFRRASESASGHGSRKNDRKP